jgi:hypothetical protein
MSSTQSQIQIVKGQVAAAAAAGDFSQVAALMEQVKELEADETREAISVAAEAYHSLAASASECKDHRKTSEEAPVGAQLHVSRHGSVSTALGRGDGALATSIREIVSTATSSASDDQETASTSGDEEVASPPDDQENDQLVEILAKHDADPTAYAPAPVAEIVEKPTGYAAKKKKELVAAIKARDLVVKGLSTMKKEDLVEILTKHDADPTAFAPSPDAEIVEKPTGYAAKTKKELVATIKGRELKVKGMSAMKKAQLADILTRHDTDPAAFETGTVSQLGAAPGNQCHARMFNQNREGRHQCRRHACGSGTFCNKHQKQADAYDGRVGPDLWKHCYDTMGSGAKMTVPGMWFGSVDQSEPGFDVGCPPTSFVGDDGKKVVVCCYPNNPNHAAVERVQAEAGAILIKNYMKPLNHVGGHWSASWHESGRAAAAQRRAAKKSEKKVSVVVEDPFEEELDDDEVVAEVTLASNAEGDVGGDGEGDTLVKVVKDGCEFLVNTATLEITHTDGSSRGCWNMMVQKPYPVQITKKWLEAKGFPSEDAIEAATDLMSDGSDDDDDDM